MYRRGDDIDKLNNSEAENEIVCLCIAVRMLYTINCSSRVIYVDIIISIG